MIDDCFGYIVSTLSLVDNLSVDTCDMCNFNKIGIYKSYELLILGWLIKIE